MHIEWSDTARESLEDALEYTIGKNRAKIKYFMLQFCFGWLFF